MAGGGKRNSNKAKENKKGKHAHVLTRVKDYKTPECVNS